MTFDTIPVRTELTVLPADDPKVAPLGWPMTVYQGTRIARLVEGKLDETPLCKADDLREGMAIVVTGIMGRFEAVVVKEEGSLVWKSDRATGPLEFAVDDRQCWTSPGSHIIGD